MKRHNADRKSTDQTIFTLLLIGNPNSGKTTIYNALTGGREYTGNRMGVTVERKEGLWSGGNVKIADLPGVYSLKSAEAEERAAAEAMRTNDGEVIVNVVDASNLERNLYLTLQLIEKGVPIVVALTFTDTRAGKKASAAMLEKKLGIPVISVSGKTGAGLSELISTARRRALLKPKTVKERSPKERYDEIEKILIGIEYENGRSDAQISADRFITGRFFALPIFLLVMLGVFYLTFGPFGSYLAESMAFMIDRLIIPAIERGMNALGVSQNVTELLCSRIMPGVGTVIAFTPQIAILFFCLSILEDSGYLARTAFLADSVLSKIGLSGKSMVPLLLGFGCSVPAIMAARTVSDEKERRRLISLIPFMSCSAKLPVYGLVAGTIFRNKSFIIVFALYILGIALGALSGKILFSEHPTGFILELPPYRLPTMKNALPHMWKRVAEYIKKAGSVILLSGLLIWILRRFDLYLQPAISDESSILGLLGKILVPVFRPLGFGTWQTAAALLTGLIAKEGIAATLSTFCGFSASVGAEVTGGFTPLSAISFLVFVLLYPPCAAALHTMRKEGGRKTAAFSALWQILIAWIAAFLVYQGGRMLGLG